MSRALEGWAPEADLYLLGSGVQSFFDLSLGTQYLLEECGQVFCLHDMPSLERYLARLTPEPVNLLPRYYREGRDRGEIYDDIVAHVLGACRPEGEPVAFLMHGHPLFYSTISERLLERGREVGLRVVAVPGVSSLDRMFVDLELDPARHGLQVLEATSALAAKKPLCTDHDLLFLQVGGISDLTATRTGTAREDAVAEFRDYLLGSYPPSHPVRIVECAVEVGFEAQVTEVPLGRLVEAAPVLNYNASAHLPPLEL